MNKKQFLLCAFILTLCSSFVLFQKDKPVFYIIGDSTVRNGSGAGASQLWGWGSFMAPYFDTTKIKVENHAVGGRSSRTFITEGKWDRILATLKKGDYIIMQFLPQRRRPAGRHGPCKGQHPRHR